MFEPIETGRETQWFHTGEIDTDPAPHHYESELGAIEAAVDRLSKHIVGVERSSSEAYSIDWQLYLRHVIHEVVETSRGLTTSTTVTPLEKGTSVRLTLIPPA